MQEQGKLKINFLCAQTLTKQTKMRRFKIKLKRSLSWLNLFNRSNFIVICAFSLFLPQYSRNVSQTCWIIDDERMGEASVEVFQIGYSPHPSEMLIWVSEWGSNSFFQLYFHSDEFYRCIALFCRRLSVAMSYPYVKVTTSSFMLLVEKISMYVFI